MNRFDINDVPASLYRLQLNKNFPFKEAIKLIPYLRALGFDGVYCSPIFATAEEHGYGVTNPNRINPALGSLEDYHAFCALLKKNQMKQVLDVIPNHMSIKGKDNVWWLDVLEKGKRSLFADFFDIYWNAHWLPFHGKVLLAILNDLYENCLHNQQLKLVWDDGFWISYEGYYFPISLSTYPFILKHFDAFCSPKDPKERQCLEESLTSEKALGKTKEKLTGLYRKSEGLRDCFEKVLKRFNGIKGNLESFELLHHLLENQFFKLAYWKAAGNEINYRRFFNINELIAIQIEKEHVFKTHHQWVLQLVESGVVQGLRIDHPDGLYDPVQYFKRLKKAHPGFIIVEKILSNREELNSGWEVDGTVGYEFLAILNRLYVRKKNEKVLTRIYREWIGKGLRFDDLLYQRKLAFIQGQFGGEVLFLTSLLLQFMRQYSCFCDVAARHVLQALQVLAACFPVYRTYIKQGSRVSQQDKHCILEAIRKAKQKAPEANPAIYDYLEDLFLLKSVFAEENKSAVKDFIQRFEQMTGAVMAKGLEDSTFFIYNRLIALNEVGGCPDIFGVSKASFHRFNKEKLKKWPLGFLCSSTHDTKMSEDSRMRLAVLSEIPKEWNEMTSLWKKCNKEHKQRINGELFPDPNTEYYIYQMLLALWPRNQKQTASAAFKQRIWNSLQKVVREAGIYTNWESVDESYEKAARDFLDALLDREKSRRFYSSFLPFQEKVKYYGDLNSLSSLLLKIGSCGIAEVYQGNESWNYRWTDPDNRGVVNYKKYKEKLQEASLSRLDTLKLLITSRALRFRSAHKKLFLEGRYTPLKIKGDRRENVIAFLREKQGCVVVIVAGRFFTEIPANSGWEKTEIILPKSLQASLLTNVLTGERLQLKEQASLPLTKVLQELPGAILTNEACDPDFCCYKLQKN